jgi:hypothetical protein
MVSPTQRSLKYMRDDDWTCGIVEKWNHFTKIRQDLFGFADVIAMKPDNTPILLQITSTGWSSRLAKILAEPRALVALNSGFEIQVHGWRKLKQNRNRYTIKCIQVTTDMFDLPVTD